MTEGGSVGVCKDITSAAVNIQKQLWKITESPFFSSLFLFSLNSFFQAKAFLVICAWLHVCHVNVYECTL